MTERWTVGEVAEAARVTVRTLHHYDDIGLLVPSGRSDSGYRLYARGDLERLQQILLYRELGFPLEAIAPLLDDPGMDRATALRAQRDLLVEKRTRVDGVIRAVDRILDSLDGKTTMTAEEMFEGFIDLPEAPEEIRHHHRRHATEANERWGETDAYKESMRRAKNRSRQEWERLKREGEALEARMAALLREGAAPDGEEAMAGAEAMRRHIEQAYYPCSPAMHAGLADMYEQDPRFRAHYDQRQEGLATFVVAAIRANVSRLEAEGT